MNTSSKLLFGLLTGLALLLPRLTQASAFVVNTTADGGAGSLRQAILNANADATATPANPHQINITVTGSITVVSPFLVVTNHMTIQGSGVNSLTISGANASRIFWLQNGTITIRDLTLANGRAKGGDGGGGGMGAGGAIFMHEGREGGSGTLNVKVINVNLTNNQAQGGSHVNANSGGGLGGDGGFFGGGGGVLGAGASFRAGGGVQPAVFDVGGGNGGLPIFGSGGNGDPNSGGTGEPGGFGGGGGSGQEGSGSPGFAGGNGGFGGGGGFGGDGVDGFPSGAGGTGGFGGGGGCVGLGASGGTGGPGGQGGFGGGGGFSQEEDDSQGGFGGGNGSTSDAGGGMGAGGAIFVTSGLLQLTNVTFTGNTATGGTGANNGKGLGGAIFIFNKADNGRQPAPGTTNDPSVSACGLTFSNNTAADQGNVPGSNDNNQYGVIISQLAITRQPASSSIVCAGANVTTSVSVSGTGPFTYQWYKGGQLLSPPQTTSVLTLNSVTTANFGSYSVVVSSSCTSVTSAAFNLTVNPTPAASLSNNGPISCARPIVTLMASPAISGFNYSFSRGPSGSANTATVSTTGIYSVTVTSGGCSATAQTSVSASLTPPTASLSNNGPLTCSQTTVTLTATSNGTTYAFTGPNNFSQRGPSPTASVSAVGNYSVVVTGTNGCTNTAQTTVTALQTPPTGSLSNSGPLSCANPVAVLSASGGGSYELVRSVVNINGYQIRQTEFSSNGFFNVSLPGTYSVIVRSGNGCATTLTTSVGGTECR